MSRGPGVWQRPILRATSDAVVVTVRQVVKTVKVNPDPDDFKSAKRGARGLALAGRSVREIGQLLGNGKPVSRQTVYRALGMLTT